MSSEGDPRRHARRKDLFHAALDRPRGEREEYLRQACGDDGALAREVKEMLAVEEGAPDFLETTAVPGEVLGEAVAAVHPDRLGPFRILRLLGEGGMGSVYEAEQERPRRSVALKVLQPGLGTPQMLRRFELESEVLGRLQHPGIARIYEVGSSDTGRGPQPWFAMELVDGVPLTQHCQDNALPLEARLELMAKVADAVQHAHQRGVVHRDLKPANVLVEPSGQPKVLDFGIARATDGELQRATLATDPGMIIGTLQYMSPEQASADPDAIDVRTDVYSLGVLLYELAAGRPPLDLGGWPMHEALRRVLDVEPEPLRTAGARVPVDVAVIAHTALAKDKERRYASAAGLAADLRRFLRREPITAQPPSRWYRLQRFVARNKPLVGGAIATLLALVLGLAVAIWQRNEALEALARAEGINRFLLSDLIASPSPERLGRDVRVVDVLGPAVRSAERTFQGQPRVAAEVLDAIAASYRGLGLVTEAEALTRRALELLGEDGTDRLSLRARGNQVAVLTDLDRGPEAVLLGESVVADCVSHLGSDDPDTLARRMDLANARCRAGDYERGLREMRALIADQVPVLGREDARTLEARGRLAINLAVNGAVIEARDLLASNLEVQDRALGSGHPATLRSRSNLGWILTMGGEWEQAEALYSELLPALAEVYGADHPYTALARVEMSQCPLHLDRAGEAKQILAGAIEVLEVRVGSDHGWTLKALLLMAQAHFRMEDYDEAITLAKRVVAKHRVASTAPENLGHALSTLGRCHQEADDDRAAINAFAEAAEVFRAAFDEPTDYLAQALFNLGVATRNAGDAAAAIAPLQEAMGIDIKNWGPHHRHVVSDRSNLARTLLIAGRPDEAVEQMRAALQSVESLELDRERVLGYHETLGHALIAAGESAEGERQLLLVIEGFDELGQPGERAAQRARRGLVELYQRQGRAEEAAFHREQIR